MKNIKKVTAQAKPNYRSQPISKALLEQVIKDKLSARFAQVDPEYLKKLSTLVERELKAHKDTEDYNMDLVSEVVDKAIKVFMEGGQEAILPGDYIQVENKITSKIDGTKTDQDYTEAVKTGEYEKFPFSSKVEAELRSIFLLQTSKKDTFKTLMEQMEHLSSSFFSPGQFQVLQSVIQKAEERIFKNPLIFPAPLEGNEQGLLRELTEGEAKEYNLQSIIMVDERMDNHDLLALKDLVLMMEGKKVHPLAFGPSFFAKYLPELKQAGYDGVMLITDHGVLKSIKLTKLPVSNLRYSPVEAAAQVFFNLMAEFKMSPAPEGSINKLKCEILKFDQYALSDSMKVYVVVDGCVAIPSNKTPYALEGVSKNDTRMKAGEVFVLEKIEKKPVLTRIGLVPYDYRPLHIFHQHGSMILGGNDQSLQSCYKEAEDFAENVINDYRQYWKEMVDSGVEPNGDAFSAAVVAARINHFLKDKDGKETTEAQIFDKENKKALELAMHSISEQTGFTLFWTLQNLHYYHMIYSGTVRKEITKMVEFEAPLSRRWLAKTYIENGSGITVDKQPTFYVKLAEDLKKHQYKQSTELYLKLKAIDQKIASGLSNEEAIKQVYSKEVAEEYKKLN